MRGYLALGKAALGDIALFGVRFRVCLREIDGAVGWVVDLVVAGGRYAFDSGSG